MWVLYVFGRGFVGLRANENLGRNERRLLAIHGYKGQKSNSYYRNKCLAIISRLQVMMELHTYDLTLIANKRHRV